MTDKITEYLQEQKRLAEAATPGPWARTHEGFNHRFSPFNYGLATCGGCGQEARCSCGYPRFDGSEHDQATVDFIAAARESVPKLIAALGAVAVLPEKQTRPNDASHVLSQIAGYNNALREVRTVLDAALGGDSDE